MFIVTLCVMTLEIFYSADTHQTQIYGHMYMVTGIVILKVVTLVQ